MLGMEGRQKYGDSKHPHTLKKVIKPQTELKRWTRPDHIMLKCWASRCRKQELIKGCKSDKKPAIGGLWEVVLNAVN